MERVSQSLAAVTSRALDKRMISPSRRTRSLPRQIRFATSTEFRPPNANELEISAE